MLMGVRVAQTPMSVEKERIGEVGVKRAGRGERSPLSEDGVRGYKRWIKEVGVSLGAIAVGWGKVVYVVVGYGVVLLKGCQLFVYSVVYDNVDGWHAGLLVKGK